MDINIINPTNSEKEIINSNCNDDNANDKKLLFDQSIKNGEIEKQEIKTTETENYEENFKEKEQKQSKDQQLPNLNEIFNDENDKLILNLKNEGEKNEATASKIWKDEVQSVFPSNHNAQMKKSSMAINDLIFLELQNFYNLIKVIFKIKI